MKVFIIGASGLVGSHCMLAFKEHRWDVKGSHLNFATPETVSFDVLNEDLEKFFNEIKFIPDLIIHCAALTNVDYCETNQEESYKSTVAPTVKIVDFCSKKAIKLVYISTDYVFDGENGPYLEDSKVNPINVYGKHKLKCEELVSELSEFLILRITNVYGEESRKKNFISRLLVDMKGNIEKTLNLPYDQFATPIYAGDIARMTFMLVENRKTGIYNLSSTDYYNRFQLASKVKSYFSSNTSFKLNAVKTSDSQQTALRPLKGGLLNVKFVCEFPEFQFTNVDAFIIKSLKNGI